MGDPLRQVDGIHSPAPVPKHALVRSGASHIAGQEHLVGVIVGCQGDGRPLAFGSDGANGKVGAQGPLARVVDNPGYCANFCVGMSAQILLQEVKEATFPLEQRQQLQGGRRIRGGVSARLSAPDPCRGTSSAALGRPFR